MRRIYKILASVLFLGILAFSFPKSVSASVTFGDNFDRGDSSTLGNGWVEDLGDWSINSNRLISPVQDNIIVHNTNAPISADYYVQVSAESSDANSDSPAVLARFTDTSNFYLFQSGNGRAQLYKRVSGSWTLLDEVRFIRSVNTFNTYRLQVNGDQIRGFIDDIPAVYAQDSSLTNPGYGGLRRGGGLFQVTFDNFEVGDLSIPTLTPIPTPTTTTPATFSDDFNRDDSSDLANGWVEDSGDWYISSDQLVSPLHDNVIVHNTNAPSSANYSIQVDAMSASATDDSPAVLARFVDANNFYLFQSGDGRAQLYKRVGGNWNILDNEPFIRSANTFNTYKIEVSGNQISGYIDGTLVASTTDDSLADSGYGGLRSGGSTVQVTFDNFEIGDSGTPNPLPTPTPPGVSKVIFLPGFGGSWNADAILNCKTSGYSGEWSLAPYANDVYKNLLDSLPSSGWITKAFYYDWRRDVRDNAAILSSFINSNSQSNEKVDIVAHSMGGLVGRAYLESTQGQKVDSFFSAGSPYQGVAKAYPAWSGGDVWDDNLFSKIATTIYLKRCGGVSSDRQTIQNNIPSIQNTLQTNDYLRNSTNNLLKPVANMIAINNWQPTNFDSPFWGVRVGTLSGNGFPTLKVIRIKNPSNHDISLGNWLDGKPNNKEYSNQGDGTVMTQSSQLTGANNQTINQNHAGLVASNEGVNKIKNFLGNPVANNFKFIKSVYAAPSPNNSIYIEPNSALVLIGFPGNFWITDKNGKVTHDQNGMITFTNPTKENYQLDIVPQANDTLFIVAQFLPNGQVLYKEYHFNNLQPKAKVIDFDPKDPKTDILKDKKDFKRPHFPENWWRWFWRLHFED